MVSELPFTSIKPVDVLYYYDEPLIFRVESNFTPLIAIKTDEEGEFSQYLVVSSSVAIVEQLRAGKLSLRSAFSQPWCWLIWADLKFEVRGGQGMSLPELDQDLLPPAGVGLFAHHGYVRDEVSAMASSPFLRLAFTGGDLKRSTIPFGSFKQLIDEVYSSIRMIFGPVLDKMSDGGLSEVTIGRILNIPLYEPKFASLSLAVDRPTLDLSAVRRVVDIDTDAVSAKFDAAAASFFDDAQRINELAREDGLEKNVKGASLTVLGILAQMMPNENTIFEILEISTSTITGSKKVVTFDSETGQRVQQANSIAVSPIEIRSGKMIEVNLKSNTFVLNAEGREVTCWVGAKMIQEVYHLLQSGQYLKVSGPFWKRQRRDYMVVNSVILSTGRIIDRFP